jgi:AraC family transcriptional regulator
MLSDVSLIPGTDVTRLFESPALKLSVWHCRSNDRKLSPERVQADHVIAFPGNPPFSFHASGRASVVEINSVLLHNAQAAYRTQHLFGGKDSGHSMVLRRDLLLGVLAHADPRAVERPDAPFLQDVMPRTARAHLLKEALFRRASDGVDEPFAIEELALQLAECVTGLPVSSRKAQDHAPTPWTAELVEAVKGEMCGRLGEKLTIDSVARRVEASPFHLIRSFRRITGESAHRYRVRARARSALSRLFEGWRDLPALAREVGFSNHSHLTSCFRREFGMTPSEVIRSLRARDFKGLMRRGALLRT